MSKHIDFLMNYIQEKKFQKVGTSKLLTVDVRIIAATNRNLIEEVGAGRFREDALAISRQIAAKNSALKAASPAMSPM